MKRPLLSILCLMLSGCWDQEVGVGIWRANSESDRRIEANETHGMWEFKFTHKGRWAISCRPPGTMSALGLNYWTDLKRDPNKDHGRYKVFSGNRLGDAVEVHVHDLGAAHIRFERDGDTIQHHLRTTKDILDNNSRRFHEQEIEFFKTVHSRN